MTIQDEQLEELRGALKELHEEPAERRVTINNPGGSSGTLGGLYPPTGGYYANNSVTTTSITGGGYTVGLNSSHPNAVYTSTGTGATWAAPWGASNNTELNAGQLNLNGEHADVVVNGKSLAKTLASLEERLNILTPNPELEKEWDELRELGNRYRKLEADLKEKAEMWDKLKKMEPPPLY